MKFINYLFTNTVSVVSLFWKSILILCGGGILLLVGGSFLLKQHITTTTISGLLTKPEVISQIDNVSTFLTGDQYIQISETSGFITNKTGTWFETTNAIITTQLDGNCEEWFAATNKKGALITNKAICLRDTSKQQVITRSQVMSGIMQEKPHQSALFSTHQSFQNLFSGDVITLTQSGLQALISDSKAIIQSPSVINSITEGIKTLINLMLIPLSLTMILVICMIMIIALIGVTVYSIIIWAVCGIMHHSITLHKAYSISRLPYLLIECWGILVGYHRSLRLVLWLVLSIIITYYYYEKTHE